MIYLFSHTPHEDAKHVKSIYIEFLRPTLTCKDFDALIFTSKNAVIAFDKLGIDWVETPSFTIGEATASEVIKHGGNVKFISKKSHGDEFAREIKPFLEGKKILFPRAKKVVSNIKERLKPLHVNELIVYETKCITCKDMEKPPLKSTLIFTSPSSVECFLKCFLLDKSYKIVCIGKKTAQALPEGFTCKIPQTQSIDKCMELAKE